MLGDKNQAAFRMLKTSSRVQIWLETIYLEVSVPDICCSSVRASEGEFEVHGYVQSSLLQEQCYVWINILHGRILSSSQ